MKFLGIALVGIGYCSIEAAGAAAAASRDGAFTGLPAVATPHAAATAPTLRDGYCVGLPTVAPQHPAEERSATPYVVAPLISISEAEEEDDADAATPHLGAANTATPVMPIAKLRRDTPARRPLTFKDMCKYAPLPPASAAGAVSRLDVILASQTVEVLLAATTEEQNTFLDLLAFKQGKYTSAFFRHPRFEVFLAEVDACQAFEKPNYSVWELFDNLSNFFSRLIPYDSILSAQFAQKARFYGELAKAYSDEEPHGGAGAPTTAAATELAAAEAKPMALTEVGTGAGPIKPKATRATTGAGAAAAAESEALGFPRPESRAGLTPR